MDIELIQRFHEGDLSAFDQLASAHYYKAKQTAYLITQNKELAEKIVQDPFLLCYRKLHLLGNPECFKTWFYKVLIRMSKKALKKEKWQTFLSFRDDLQIHGLIYKEMANNQNQLYLALYEAINQLRPALRKVVILYYFNDMPTQLCACASCYFLRVCCVVLRRLGGIGEIHNEQVGKGAARQFWHIAFPPGMQSHSTCVVVFTLPW